MASSAARDPLSATPGGNYARAPQEDLGDMKALKRIRDKRHCTDITCCMVFLAFCAGMGYITYTSIKRGNPQRLYHGFDYKGNLCGVSDAVKNAPLMYWPRPDKLKYPICVGHCPDSALEQVMFPTEKVKSVKQEGGKRIIEIVQDSELVHTYPSKVMGGRFCLPMATHGVMANFTNSVVAENLGSPLATIAEKFHDVTNAWAILLFMVPFAIVLGYLYLFWLKHCAKILTWLSVFSLIAISAGVAAYCLLVLDKDEAQARNLLGRYTEHPVKVVKVTGYVACGVTAILLIGLCILCRTISRIVGCIEASCDAIWAMPFLLPLPIFDIALKILYGLVWLVLFTWVITSGEVAVPSAEFDGQQVHGLVRTFHFTTEDKVRIGYYIVGLVWGVEMITAVMNYVISYCVAIWYFTPCMNDGNYTKREIDHHSFLEGLYSAFRYHLGSLALGSFIVALFRLVNMVLEVIAKYAKGSGNHVAEAVANCCMCCVWCFEEVVRFVNKNAFIEMVLKSTDFFTSAGGAIKTLASASAEVAGLNGVTVIFQVLGMLGISLMCSGVSYLLTTHVNMYTSKSSDLYIESPWAVVAVSGIIGLIIGAAYMYIFDMVSDTLLFCWLIDTEDGVTEFAPKPLRNLVGHPQRKKGQKNTDF